MAKPTNESGEQITPEQFTAAKLAAQKAADELVFLTRVKMCLRRWAERFAQSPHAVAHVKESLLLMQEIDERILKL